MRFFNTAGPCEPAWHYMLPAEARIPAARGLIDQGAYFVIHAPRQTGKTTSLRSLAPVLTAEGKYAALHFSCEAAEPAGEDYEAAQLAILEEIQRRSQVALPPELWPPSPWPQAHALSHLSAGLTAWARACPRPLVLFFDEIDALRGESLRSVLRQLRAGYPDRAEAFPWSVIACGLRDVRDYKMASGGDADRLGTSSPFNIKVKSMRLGDFTEDEVRALYAQHTAESGQPFTEPAVRRAFEVTQGQPWLVNALAREVLEEMKVRPPEPVTGEHVESAKERLILARATHLDSLVAKLREPRVRRIVEPVIAGNALAGDAYDDDSQYVRDLGLVAPGKPLRIANPIYREVIVRVLSNVVEDNITAEPKSFVLPDGHLDFGRILREFTEFWIEHGEVLTAGMAYHEVAPQLVLMAYCQRVVNGGGYIDREYGVGRGRIDLCVRWPYRTAEGARAWQREAVELKVWRHGTADPLARGLLQLEGYLDQLGLDRGVLAIFDRRPEALPIEERTRFEQARTAKGYEITVLRA